ncbi:hypothetical protein SBRCBS47491_006966 [Sporothrix bragantina]|uniref:Fibronectin type-III domain-containing protein n=1 Tax=Sporothrix bragantina TaxID=671064 RepID=A0ABP0CAW6_9PEZI
MAGGQGQGYTVRVAWDPLVGSYDIHCYGMLAWDLDEPGAFATSYATTGTTLDVPGLTAGHRYGFWVATYINLAWDSVADFLVTPGGVPAPGNHAIVGSGTPGPPASLQFTAVDGTTIQFSWSRVANAAGYTLYMRSVKDGASAAYKVIGSTTDTSQGVAFLFPSIWTYEFCVGSYNGNLQSSYGGAACVTPPVCCGYHASKRKREHHVRGPARVDGDAMPAPTLFTGSNTGSSNATTSITATTSNTTAQAILLTADPQVGQLYSLYTQAMSSLQSGTTLNLTFAVPDTVIRMF